PPIYIAAMNKLMLRLAGSHCDGVHIHALHSVKYLEEVAMPELAVGWQRGEREREDFSVSTAVFALPTDDADYAAWAEHHICQQISFYLSTPAYRVIAELHGWQEDARRLSEAARSGEWEKMPGMVNDQMMDTFVVTGTWADLPGKVKAKYGRLLDRVSYYLPYIPGENEEGWRTTVRGFAGE
ncbi:MAG: LLM class flavin-dependent oxidoreductase, partial [Candidatus Promineifilaceae bacterium]|nr:LLM class flavin-dependent oxidoreductase [Candidatus Promineifilaceae bacterium]